MTSLAKLVLEDMHLAINRNSEYRELGVKQWATMAAHRAREFYPYLREDV